MRVGKSFGRSALAAVCAGLCLLSGCSDSLPSLPKVSELNPFKENEPPLPGKRIPVMPSQEKIASELADGSAPIALPPRAPNDSWAQPGGEPTNAPGHLELADLDASGLERGRRNGLEQDRAHHGEPDRLRRARLHARCRRQRERVRALRRLGRLARVARADRREQGVGFSASSFFSLGGDDGGAYGGGLAADGGRIYAASGYGNVIALDPGSGKRLWEKSDRRAGARLADRVRRARLSWSRPRDASSASRVSTEPSSGRCAACRRQASLGLNSSPAVDGDIVVVPYPSGDLVALKIADGSAVWSENLSRTRTTSQLASMSDAARPAIDGGVVFAIGHGGRMVATQAKSGERLWSINVPGTQTPWVAGESVFVVDTSGQLMAISRRDGKMQWTAKLAGARTWSGPTLAGNVLWLASNKGQLVGVDAPTGRVIGEQDLGDPVYIAPVVAQGRMFVLTDNAKLIALN